MNLWILSSIQKLSSQNINWKFKDSCSETTTLKKAQFTPNSPKHKGEKYSILPILQGKISDKPWNICGKFHASSSKISHVKHYPYCASTQGGGKISFLYNGQKRFIIGPRQTKTVTVWWLQIGHLKINPITFKTILANKSYI